MLFAFEVPDDDEEDQGGKGPVTGEGELPVCKPAGQLADHLFGQIEMSSTSPNYDFADGFVLPRRAMLGAKLTF